MSLQSPYRDDHNTADSMSHQHSLSFDRDNDQQHQQRQEPNHNQMKHRQRLNIRGDGYGNASQISPASSTSSSSSWHRYNRNGTPFSTVDLSVQSHNYEPDESEVWRAHVAQQHFSVVDYGEETLHQKMDAYDGHWNHSSICGVWK
jgi:hypothetical protein